MKEFNVNICKDKQGGTKGSVCVQMNVENTNKNFGERMKQYASLMKNEEK